MSKPIILTEEIISEMAEEFANSMRNRKIADGSITYKKNFTYEKGDSITISFSPIAFSKMITLLQKFDTEVAWHGVVDRASDGFLVTDIFVYPQEVSGVTVNTDQEEYQKWLMELDDETANKLLMQGHSHVSMATTPSSTDINHQEGIIAQLGGNNYYIFMIWNKKMESTIKVYDLACNTLYEDGDVSIKVAGVDCDFEAFVKDANNLVKKSYAATGSSYYGSGYQSNEKTSGYTNKTTHYLNYDKDEKSWDRRYIP